MWSSAGQEKEKKAEDDPRPEKNGKDSYLAAVQLLLVKLLSRERERERREREEAGH